MKPLHQHIEEKLVINKNFNKVDGPEEIAKYLIKMLNITYRNTSLLDDTTITDWVIEYIVEVLNKENITYVKKYEFYTGKNNYINLPSDLKKYYKVVKWKTNIHNFKKICELHNNWTLLYKYNDSRGCYDFLYIKDHHDLNETYTCFLYV